jgi:hypothetical protein
MGEIIPFRRRNEIKVNFDTDLSNMLKDVVELKKESLGTEINGIFQMNTNFENLLKAKIGSFIVDHRLIDAELFRCGLYVSDLLNEMLSKTFESYYATDYFIHGLQEQDPLILKEGADLCCVLCILFDARQTWRMMRPGDYAIMGVRLYSLSYSLSKRVIAWCMSRYFDEITSIARKCIENMQEGHS